MNYFGTLRIKNPKTLQKWIDKGWFKKELDNGYSFYPACGRFRKEKCECLKCKKPNAGAEIKKILQLNNLQ